MTTSESGKTTLKPDLRSIPVRTLESLDPSMFAIFAVMLTLFSDESGLDAVVAGVLSALGVAVVYILILLATEAIRWWRAELAFEGESLVVTSGILEPKRRTIPFSRIQQSSVSTTAASRPLGLAALECETAGGSDPEKADLSVRYLERAVAEDLQSRLRAAADRNLTPPEPADYRRLFTLRPRELAIHAAGRTHLLSVLGAVGIWLGARYVEPGPVVDLQSAAVSFVEDSLGLAPAVTLLGVALAGWLVGVALAGERMAGFRLSAAEDSFRRRHGLVRTTDAELSRERIQLARVRSTPFHRLLGLAQADVGTAGISDVTVFGLQWPLAPLAERDAAWGLVERAVGVDRSSIELRSLPARARRRYVVRYALAVVALTVATALAGRFVSAARAIPLWSFLPLLALAPLAGHVTWVHRGYAVLDEAVVVRSGFWRRQTHVVPTDTVQNLSVSRSPLQERIGLVSVRLDVASMPFLPGIPIPDVDGSVGTELRGRLLDGDGAITEGVADGTAVEST